MNSWEEVPEDEARAIEAGQWSEDSGHEEMKSFEGLAGGLDFTTDEFSGFDEFYALTDDDSEDDDLDFDRLIPVSAANAKDELLAGDRCLSDIFLPEENHFYAAAADPWTRQDPWSKPEIEGSTSRAITTARPAVLENPISSSTFTSSPSTPTSAISVFLSRSSTPSFTPTSSALSAALPIPLSWDGPSALEIFRKFVPTAGAGPKATAQAELWTDLDDEELQEVEMVGGGTVEGADSSVEFAAGMVDIEGEVIGVSSSISSRFLSSSRRRRLRKF